MKGRYRTFKLESYQVTYLLLSLALVGELFMRTTFFQAKNPVRRLVKQDCSLVDRNIPLGSRRQRLPCDLINFAK